MESEESYLVLGECDAHVVVEAVVEEADGFTAEVRHTAGPHRHGAEARGRGEAEEHRREEP